MHQFRSGEVTFSSDPDGAEVELDNGMSCTTPCTLVLNDVVKQEAKATLDGETTSQTMLRRPAVPFWLNLIIGLPGAVGMGIDALTGDMWVYKLDAFHFDFKEDEDDDDSGDAAAAPAKPKAAKAPEKKKTAEPPPAEAPPAEAAPKADPNEAPLPETPIVQTMREDYPESYLTTQVGYYYGHLSKEDLEKTLNRLYRILIDMQANGERPDVDEAVRRDRFDKLYKAPAN